MPDWSLLDSNDPVLSLLGGIASGGRVGDDGSITGTGATTMAPSQRRTALDSLLASGAAFANAGAPGFGPRPTLAQGLSQGLLAGSIAGQAAQDHSLAQEQSAQVMAQAGRDADIRRQLIAQQLANGNLARNLILQRFGGQAPTDDGATAPGGFPSDGTAPGMGVRDALRAHEQGKLGYQSVNALGFSGAYQMGSPLMKDAGLYVPADPSEPRNAWGGVIKIPGFGDMKRDDFLKSPAAQEQAYGIMMGHLDKQLQGQGVYDLAQRKMVNGQFGGVPVTREGLLAGAWLGGVDGVRRWLTGEGDADDGRTRVSDYVRMGSSGARPAAGGAPPPAQPARPGPQGVQIAQGGATPILNDASGPPAATPTIAAGGAPIDTTVPVAGVGGPVLSPAVPRGPPPPLPIGGTTTAAATNAPVRPTAGSFLRNATPEQLAAAMLAKDPLKALADLAGEKVRIETRWNQGTGQNDKLFVNNNGDVIGKFGSEAPKYEQSTEIGADGQARSTYRIPGTNVVQQGGVVPGHTSLENRWNPATGQVDRIVLDANRNPTGQVASSEKPAYRYQTETMPDGQTYHTERIEGVPGYVKQIGVAPRDIKQVKEYDQATGRTLIWNLDANGNKQGTPLVSPELPGEMKEIQDDKDPTVRHWAAFYPGQTQPQILGRAPTPPELAALSEQRFQQNRQLQHPYTPEEQKYREAVGDQEAAVLKNATLAPTTRNQVQTFLALQNDMNTGKPASAFGSLGQWFDAFGLGNESGIPGFGRNAAVTQPALTAIRQQLVQQMMSGPTGFGHNQISDADLKTLQGANISLGNNADANKVLGSLMLRSLDRQEAAAAAWAEAQATAEQAGKPRPRFDQWVTHEWKSHPGNVELLPTVTPDVARGLAPGTVYKRRGQPGIYMIPEAP